MLSKSGLRSSASDTDAELDVNNPGPTGYDYKE